MNKSISIAEAEAIIRQAKGSAQTLENMLNHLDAFAEFVEDGTSQILLCEGNITLPYLAVQDDILLFAGDLTVNGILEDAIETNISLLLVLGDVHCQNLFTFSQICIAGNLTVENTIVADSLCDYSLDVGGDITAHAILEKGHWFEVGGTVQADYIYAWHCTVQRQGVLAPNLADDDMRIDVQRNPEKFKGVLFQRLPDEWQTDAVLDLGKAVELAISGKRLFAE
ncbi:MAG: hypothetical protein MUD08_06170 [Cytophagales bacterium]|jgi:hypothetical protein|nr:hypothetical protein [Cytophagales bacterium]